MGPGTALDYTKTLMAERVREADAARRAREARSAAKPRRWPTLHLRHPR